MIFLDVIGSKRDFLKKFSQIINKILNLIDNFQLRVVSVNLRNVPGFFVKIIIFLEFVGKETVH